MKPNHVSNTFRTRLYSTVTAGLEVTDSGLVIKLLVINHPLSDPAPIHVSFYTFRASETKLLQVTPPPEPTRDPPKNVTSEILLNSTSKAIELHLLVKTCGLKTEWKTCGEFKNGKMPPCEHNRIFKGRLTNPGTRAAAVR